MLTTKQIKNIIIQLIFLNGIWPCLTYANEGVSDSISKGLRPKDWNEAPSNLYLPNEWLDVFKDMITMTDQDKREHGSCLSIGRTNDIQNDLLNQNLLKMGELENNRHGWGNMDFSYEDWKRIVSEIVNLRKHLENDGTKGDDKTFKQGKPELTNKPFSVTLDACNGSDIAEMHTHPIITTTKYNLSDTSLPSAFDVSVLLKDAGKGSAWISFVVMGPYASAMVVTEEFFDNFDYPFSKFSTKKQGIYESKSIDHKKLEYLFNILKDHAISERDIWYASLLNTYGIVLYTGTLENLKKVAPANSLESKNLIWRDDSLYPNRTIDLNLYLQAKVLIKYPFEEFYMVGLKDPIEVLKSQRDNLKSDDDYLELMGQPTAERNFQDVVTNLSDEFSVGRCIRAYKNGLQVVQNCWNRGVEKVRFANCQDQPAERPNIMFFSPEDGQTTGHILLSYADSDPEFKQKCHVTKFSTDTDGFITGNPTEITTQPD
jgi:hypothetical protein